MQRYISIYQLVFCFCLHTFLFSFSSFLVVMEVTPARGGWLAMSPNESRLDANALAKWEKQKKAWAKMQEHLTAVRDGNRSSSPGRSTKENSFNTRQQQLASISTYPGMRNCDGTLKVSSLPGTLTRSNDPAVVPVFAASDGGNHIPEIDYRYNYSKQFTSPRPLLFSSVAAPKELAVPQPQSDNAYDPADCLKDIEWISSLRVPPPGSSAMYNGKDSFQQIRYAPVGRGYPYKIFSQKLVRPQATNRKPGSHADGNALHRYSTYVYQEQQEMQQDAMRNQDEEEQEEEEGLRDSRTRDDNTFFRSGLNDSKTRSADGAALSPSDTGIGMTMMMNDDDQEADPPSIGPALRLKGSEVTVVTRPGASKYVEVVMTNVGSTAIFYTLAPRDRRVVAKTVLRVEKTDAEGTANTDAPNSSAGEESRIASGGSEDGPLTVEAIRSFRDSVAKENARKYETADAVLSRPSVSDYFLLSSKRDGSILPGETKVFSFCVRSPISGTFVQEYDLLTVPSLGAAKCSASTSDADDDVREWAHDSDGAAVNQKSGAPNSGSVKYSATSTEESSTIPVIIRAHIVREVNDGESLALAIDHLITRNAERDVVRTDLRKILQPGTAFDAAEMTAKINAVADAKAAREAATKHRVELEERHWHEHNNNLYYKHRYLGEDLVPLIYAQLKRIDQGEPNSAAASSTAAANPTPTSTSAVSSGKSARNGSNPPASTAAPPRGRGAAAEGKPDKKRETAARSSARGGRSGQYSPELSQSLEDGGNGDDDLSMSDKAVLLVAKSVAGESGMRALLQIPYNRFVFEKLASLHENLRETMQALEGETQGVGRAANVSSTGTSNSDSSPEHGIHRKWNGSIQALMEDISDLRPAPLRNKLTHAVHVLLRAASVSREPEEPLSALIERAAGHLALGRTVDEMAHAADAILQNEAERQASATISALNPLGSATALPSNVMKSIAGVAVALQGITRSSSQDTSSTQRMSGERHSASSSANAGAGESTPECTREQRHQELMVLTRNALLQGVSTLCDLVDGSRDAVHVACDVPLLSLVQSQAVACEYATVQRSPELGVDTTTEIAVPPPPTTQGARSTKKR